MDPLHFPWPALGDTAAALGRIATIVVAGAVLIRGRRRPALAPSDRRLSAGGAAVVAATASPVARRRGCRRGAERP